MAVVSVACEHGREHGILSKTPVKGVKRVRRARNLPQANRPWTQEERHVVLDHVSPQLRVPVGLAIFTGLRKGDVLTLTKSAITMGGFRAGQGKQVKISLPIHPDLARLLAAAPTHDAVTIAATGAGTPWTITDSIQVSSRLSPSLRRAAWWGQGLRSMGYGTLSAQFWSKPAATSTRFGAG